MTNSTHPPVTRLTHAELGEFSGDLNRYRHPAQPTVIYTPGIRHLAERAEAHWLIDLIASYVARRS